MDGIIKSDCDNVYYNISIPHDDNIAINGSPTPADYFEIRGTPLLPCPAENYTMSVVRFSIPTSEIPIQIVPVDISLSNADINKLLYSVTLKWGAFEHQVFLQWIPTNNYAEVPQTPQLAQDIKYAPYYYLYSVKHLISIINNALTSAYLQIQNDGALITAPPFMEYDEEPGRINLFVPNNYIDEGVQIFANNTLNRNFGYGFDQQLNGFIGVINGKNAEFLINRTGTNIESITAPINPVPPVIPFFYPVQDYVQLTQDYNTISDMTSFTSIVLISRSIPLRTEWTSTQTLKGPIPLGDPIPSNGTTQDSFLNILTDFEVDISSGFELRNKIIYNPTAEFRRATLLGGNLTTIDVQAFWKDNYDNLYPIMIPAHDVLTIKLLFEKNK